MEVNDRTALLAFHDADDESEREVESRASLSSPDVGDSDRRRWTRFSLKDRGSYLQDRCFAVSAVLILMLICGGFIVAFVYKSSGRGLVCTTVQNGYQCHQKYSQHWGQYTPFFSLRTISETSPDIPVGCTVTFVQVLSRHGARYPTKNKSSTYSQLIKRIQDRTKTYLSEFAVLETFNYQLQTDDLTPFGESQLTDSGIKFYRRYQHLTKKSKIFIRASGSPRVIVSAEKFIEGFYQEKLRDPTATDKDAKPSVAVILSEDPGSNNTLEHGNCDLFEETKPSHVVQKEFAKVFASPILNRFSSHLIGSNLDVADIVHLMDLCSFHTVAFTPDARTISPLCNLFSNEEWTQYDYYNTLGKYYGFGAGNPLGASQGVGFVNELISRLTSKPVSDSTSVNHTLDSDPKTFPLGLPLYADFGHDNTMTSIFTALGIFNDTQPLSNSTVQGPSETKGFSASWIVPFAARAYIEKMECDSTPVAREPLVRVVINDRVVPLHGCKVDSLGRCRLKDFVEGLSYARAGGDWEKCSI
ncbi:3-phytase A [Paracoccidioides lutzii Pb01]|uniref:Phytase A n=1 Tax=Paracoccidioides lutzii (strain ATCC MYA-826 / Pb01) TaxID=502779 RepID=C1GXU3_PARBA|nr:3-phytase A [Paracoccidioides lutzii Pb01]EEH41663.2 3-phytase A [Paracoccidioides lutzii Pb01]